jgi:hypothetical protein
MKKITIFGERCSGTTFLIEALKSNFNIELTNHHKHFFGHDNYELDMEIIYICIYRDPYEYANSFYKNKHHLPEHITKDSNSFLTSEFYSFDINNKEILEDRHIITKNRYKNIFELINVKNDFLMNILPKKVKNHIYIKYEDLRDNYEEILKKIKDKFNLIQKNEEFIKIIKYKNWEDSNEFKINTEYLLDKELFYYYWNEFNK